jgi:hypothetical protein
MDDRGYSEGAPAGVATPGRAAWTTDDTLRALNALSPADQAQAHEYIAFLQWRAGQASTDLFASPARTWRLGFLEHLAEATVQATRDPAGMEVKGAEATVGGEGRPALWQHPPVAGESVVEFHVPVPTGLNDLRLRFAVGIRDGVRAVDRLVAFRVRVDGWQVWSHAAWPTAWRSFELGLPFQTGNVLRIAFITDGLGEHKWAWAVWGEPELIGLEIAGQEAEAAS